MSFGEWLVVSGIALASLAAGLAASHVSANGGETRSIVMNGRQWGRRAVVVLVVFLCAVGGVWLLPWVAALPVVSVWAGGVFAFLLAIGAVWGWR